MIDRKIVPSHCHISVDNMFLQLVLTFLRFDPGKRAKWRNPHIHSTGDQSLRQLNLPT